MLNEALLLLLIVGWAAVLLPGALRSRNKSAHATVGGFERAMAVLRTRPDGREIMVPREADRIVHGRRRAGMPSTPRRESPVLARRRAMFSRLVVATVAMALLAVAFRGVFVTLFLVTGTVLGCYVALLRHYKLEREQAREVVRTIDLRPHEPAMEREAEPVAVGAGHYGGVQVATRPDQPWEPHTGVRIRRWDP